MTIGEGVRVALRPAIDADQEFFARVYASTREDELSALPFTAEQRAAFLAQQFAAQSRHYAAYSETTFEVVMVDDEPAGRLIVGHWAGREHIADISLLPQFRRRGIGTQLIAEVLEAAERRGVSTTIQVERSNPAQRLYARLGFAAVAPDDDPIQRLLECPPGRADQPKTAS